MFYDEGSGCEKRLQSVEAHRFALQCVEANHVERQHGYVGSYYVNSYVFGSLRSCIVHSRIILNTPLPDILIIEDGLCLAVSSRR